MYYLIVTVCRCITEEQSRKGELLGGGVPIYQLPRNVQENAIVILVRVVQRTIGHEEEVLRGQPEGVSGGGGDVSINHVKSYLSHKIAVVSVPNTIAVNEFSFVKDAPRTILTIVSRTY